MAVSAFPLRRPGPRPMTAKPTPGATPLPLADAQRRLGRPGRSRKQPLEGDRPLVGEATGRPARPPSMRVTASALPGLCPSPSELAPRLLGLEDAGRYLSGLSSRTVRTLLATGALHRVRLPLGQSELRRVLVDRLDLDRLIEASKDGQEVATKVPR